MRQADVLYKGELAGSLVQHNDGTFSFSYHSAWLNNSRTPPVSLTLPKTGKEYKSDSLFPSFANMLPEGSNKHRICEALRIDDDDEFGLLLSVAAHDAIGAITVKHAGE